MDQPVCNCLACRLRGQLIEIHDFITQLQNSNFDRIKHIEELLEIDKGRLEVIREQEDELRGLRKEV